MAERRDALKILGSISATCAFPFSADELYGQHEHTAAMAPPAALPKPVFFTAAEFESVKTLADVIIPATDTPSASAAGVPAYIDYVVNSSQSWKTLFREGLAWLNGQSTSRFGKNFAKLNEQQQIQMVEPLCTAADQIKPPLDIATGTRATARRKGIAMEVQFFKAFKSMTADGYFTSKDGLVDTLGYKGNTVMGEFPVCEHEH